LHPHLPDATNDSANSYLFGRRQAWFAFAMTLALMLFDYVDRHYNHGADTYPLAHNPVTSHYVSGPVRFPVDLRLYRRYEECTRWEAFVRQHFPDHPIPTKSKERARLHKEVDPSL